MNRAILIVICDFLVSAMLSMMTGMVPAHTGGTGVGLDEETTQVLLAELHANRSALERMRERLRELVRNNGMATPEQEQQLRELAARIVALERKAEVLKQNREPEKLAKLSAEELRKRLEAELLRRRQAELELKDKSADLAASGKELRELRQGLVETGKAVAEMTKENAKNQQQLTRTQQELLKSQQELSRSEKQLVEANAQLKSTNTELETERREGKRREADLAGVRETLKEMNARLGQSAKEAGSLRQTLAYTTGKLDSAEREVAEITGKLNRLQKAQSVVVLERDEARRKQQELTLVVKNTVRELSQARQAAETSKVERAEAVGKLNAVQEELKEAKRKLGNHVLDCYGKGAVKVEVSILEERLMAQHKGGGVYYLPLVELGGKKLIIGHFRQFAGDLRTPLVYNKVRLAAIFLSTPGVKTPQGMPTLGPVMLADSELRAAALAVPGLNGRTPLKALTLAELRTRGVNDLYLFKAETFGKESVELDGRCSLDVSDNVPYIFIRNSGSRSELKAEPGDLVLTREGDFAAIVVDNAPRGFGRGEEARAFVFTGVDVWKSPRLIPFDKPRDARYFDGFSSAVRSTRDIIEHGDRERKKR